MMTNNTEHPDQLQPGLTMTRPSAHHQDGCDKYNTGNQTSNIRGRDNAPTTDYSDEQIEDFYSQVQRIIDQALKDILIVHGD